MNFLRDKVRINLFNLFPGPGHRIDEEDVSNRNTGVVINPNNLIESFVSIQRFNTITVEFGKLKVTAKSE